MVLVYAVAAAVAADGAGGSWAVAVALPCAVTLGPPWCLQVWGRGVSAGACGGAQATEWGRGRRRDPGALVSKPLPSPLWGPPGIRTPVPALPPRRLAPLGLPRVLHGLQDGAGAWPWALTTRKGEWASPNLGPYQAEGPDSSSCGQSRDTHPPAQRGRARLFWAPDLGTSVLLELEASESLVPARQGERKMAVPVPA